MTSTSVLAPTGNPAVQRRRLGRSLRRLRESRHLTVEQAAAAAGISPSHLSRIENAKIGVRVPAVSNLLSVYRAEPDLVAELLHLTRQSAKPGWWHRYAPTLGPEYGAYIGFETEAREIWNYDACILPGLVHTAQYTRQVYERAVPARTAQDVDRLVEVRLHRQQILLRDPPTRLRMIIDEAAVRRQVGGPEVLADQLEHLAGLAELPNIDVQVLPFTVGAHPGTDGSFIVLHLPGPLEAEPDTVESDAIVYLEAQVGQSYPDCDTDLGRFTAVFTALQQAALDPVASTEMIRAVAKGLRDE